MKIIIFLCCFTTTALAVGDKQLQLEDIESDNLANERQLKQVKQPSLKYPLPSPTQPTLQQSQRILPPSQLEYGFSPLKSAQKYVQQRQQVQQQQQQVQIPQALQYFYPQFTTPLTYPTYPQYQYQQYENVPYVVDNQLLQNSKTDQQQYYGQQFVYLQPTISPSNNIQMVIDPKGNVKYYTYVPNQYYSEVKSGENPLQSIQVQTNPPSDRNFGPQIFTREPDYRQAPRSESQYITQPQLPPTPVTEPIQYIQPTPTDPPAIQYVASTPLLRPAATREPFIASQPLAQPTELPKTQYFPKGEPQSLLDSYVPSYLQLQYYKQQQQANANSLVETPKKVVPRTTLTRQILRIPNAEIETNYNFGLPSPYRSHNFKN